MKEILRFEKISKRYPGVAALKEVNLSLGEGEILGLIGENGAGKSTLLKILSGAIRPSEGRIVFDGKETEFKGPTDAHAAGIASVYQNIFMIPNLTVAENMYLSHNLLKEEQRIILNRRELVKRANFELARSGFSEISASKKMSELSHAQQQVVAIVKALILESRILLLDEPTSALSDKEVDQFFQLLRDLKNKNVGIIFVSHHIHEVFEITDNIAILRDGELVSFGPTIDYTNERVKTFMAGKSLEDEEERASLMVSKVSDRVILNVEGLTYGTRFRDVSFELHEGEVLGFAGLVGSGRTDVARAIFGAFPYEEGEISVYGEKKRMHNPNEAMKNGVFYLTENRLEDGIFPLLAVSDNILVSNPSIAMSGPFVSPRKKSKLAREYISKINIKTPGVQTPISQLSGGNQQKCLMARIFNGGGKILILDEPTNGIDIAAKEEIHNLIRRFVSIEKERAAILISSDLSEVISESDRIAVMRYGRIVDIVPKEKATRELILSLMLEA